MFRTPFALPATLIVALAALSPAAHAQATVKADGQWRSAFGLGASLSSGNAKNTNLSASGDAVRATADDKLGLYGTLNYARSDSATTAEQLRLGGRYDRNINAQLFGYGAADLERNKPANLSLRTVLGGGLGLHAIKGETTTLDVFGGLAWTHDQYIAATTVADALRSRYSYAALVLGEESTHRLSDTTTARQKLMLLPNLRDRGEFRASWDAGVAVAMSKTMNLTAGFQFQYNSDPGTGRKKADTLLPTGISVKFD